METKAHKNLGKSSGGLTQGLSKFFRAPYMGRASRGHLCGSSAFLLLKVWSRQRLIGQTYLSSSSIIMFA